MKLTINLNYGDEKNAEGNPTNQAITSSYLYQAVGNIFPEINGQKSRIWGRIQRKLAPAVKEGADSIELETAEAEFLRRDVFDKEPKINPTASQYFSILEDEIANLKPEE